MRARARACVCVVSAIVKLPALPPCAVDGRFRNCLFSSLSSLSNVFIPLRDRCWTMPLGRRNAADKPVVIRELGVDIVGY